MKFTAFFLAMLLFLGRAGVADAAPVGFLSFDSLIPGPGGVNVFGVNNLTGDPGSGGSALPPDFPVFDSLTLLGSILELTLQDGTMQLISLGDIGPGSLLDGSGNPPAATQFSDTANFLSAIFIATLSQTSFLLSDGSLFLAASPSVTTMLLPSSGLFLTAGADFGVIDVAPRLIAVPEPATLFLVGSGWFGFWSWKQRKWNGEA